MALIILGIFSTLAQQPARGFADPLLGRWDLTIQGDTSYPSWLEITPKSEAQLTGRFVGRTGSSRPVPEITYQNGDLFVRIPVQYEPNKSDLEFKGRLVGDRLEGTTADANGKTLKWTGVRAPALHRAAPPKWGQPIELFDGKDLTGWRLRSDARGTCWNAENGTFTNTPPCADLITEKTFGDFKVHVEFNLAPKSNSGVYLRGRYEVQIEDDEVKEAENLRMAGIYGFLRPQVNAARAPGEWQTYDITLVGRQVTIVLNGKTTVENSEIPGITGGALDSNEGENGPLMLQGDHGKVSFRNVVLTPALP